MRYLYLIVLGLILSSAGAFSQTAKSNNFGLGIILGAPTGLSGNYMLSPNRSIDAAVAWDLGDEDSDLVLHSTYLFRNPGLKKTEGGDMGWYWGLGARVQLKDETTVGPRGSIGINYNFKAPVELFAEGALVMDLIPDTSSDFDMGLGVRYYF